MIAAAAFLLLGALFDQSIEKLLNLEYPDSHLSYVLLDNASGTILAQRWANITWPVPVGSLVKPFLALSASEHGKFPVLNCDPKKCWLHTGHGKVDITKAIAQSCNSYFLQLAPHANPEYLKRFGLTPPGQNETPETWIGLGREWRLSPIALAQAYRLLLTYPGAEPIRAGMRLSAASGTGKAFGARAMVKTGTASCSHPTGQPGDGYTVVITSKYTLLVQVDGVPGATAAAVAGKMFRTIQNGK